MISDMFTPGHVPVHGRVVVLGAAAAGTVSMPQGAVLTRIYARNNTSTTLSGGLKVGIASGGATVVAAGVIAASDLSAFTPLIGAANAAAARTLYFDAVTAWGVTTVDLVFEYTVVVPAA